VVSFRSYDFGSKSNADRSEFIYRGVIFYHPAGSSTV
jgi:hypothetical protein